VEAFGALGPAAPPAVGDWLLARLDAADLRTATATVSALGSPGANAPEEVVQRLLAWLDDARLSEREPTASGPAPPPTSAASPTVVDRLLSQVAGGVGAARRAMRRLVTVPEPERLSGIERELSRLGVHIADLSRATNMQDAVIRSLLWRPPYPIPHWADGPASDEPDPWTRTDAVEALARVMGWGVRLFPGDVSGAALQAVMRPRVRTVGALSRHGGLDLAPLATRGSGGVP
jgi:hypothetical protein